MNLQTLLIEQVRRDSGAQFREALDKKHVRELAGALQRGDKLTPIVVFFDGESYWLGGGFHRIEAHLSAGRTKIEVEVREGNQLEARRYGRGDNGTPLLPRTVKTKRAQVEDALCDPEWASWSDNSIADYCKVSQPFVSQMRRELGPLTYNVISQSRTYTHNKSGKPAQMKTGKIGRERAPKTTDGTPAPGSPSETGSLLSDLRWHLKTKEIREAMLFLLSAEGHRQFVISMRELGVQGADEWDIGFVKALDAAQTLDDFLLSMIRAENRTSALHDRLLAERGINLFEIVFHAQSLVVEALGVPRRFADADYYGEARTRMIPTGSDEEWRGYFAWVREDAAHADWEAQ